MNWTGVLQNIYISTEGGLPMTSLSTAQLTAGVGIEGDRYATGKGTYSNMPSNDRQVTLIESEALDAISRDYGITLDPQETRRNLITKEVPLNHLVGKKFWVGGALLYGARLNVPCKYLEKITGKSVFAPLVHRSGLNCEILESEVIRSGDLIKPANNQNG